MPNPRQFGERSFAAEDQIGERTPGQVGRGDAVSDIAAGPAEPAGLVQDHSGLPVARDTEHAAPAMSDRHVPHLRQDRVEHVGEQPDGDAIVDGALRIEEAWALSPTVSRPSQPISHHNAAGIGSVAIIELFMGNQVRRRPGSAGVKPSVAEDDRGPHCAATRARAAGRDFGDGRVLVDRDAASFDCLGQPTGQPGRLDPGAVRSMVGRYHTVDSNTFGGLLFRQLRDVDTPRPFLGDRLGEPGRLSGPAARPATVATRGPESCEPRLQHRDPQ